MNPNISIDILVVGVGGQGIVLLSDIIAEVFFKAGYNVKKSELGGLAQRGGSVISYLRIRKIREKIYSPLISEGKVDILIGMELLEAYEGMEYLKKNGLMIILDKQIPSSTLFSGQSRYPADLKSKMGAKYKNIEEISWSQISKYLSNTRSVNMFILGVLSIYFPFRVKDWQKAMKEKLPTESLDSNLIAFAAGRDKFRNREKTYKFNV